MSQKFQPEARQGDIDRGRELLPDRTGGQGRGSRAEAGIAFDHRHRAAESGIARQEIRHRTAHRPTADDHDIETLRHSVSPWLASGSWHNSWRRIENRTNPMLKSNQF